VLVKLSEVAAGGSVRVLAATGQASFACEQAALESSGREGGVDILVDEAVHVCVIGEPITYTFEPGETHLNGANALKYARTRCDSDDFDRMARQRQIQEAILRQVKASTVLSKFQDLAAAGKALVLTDMPQSMVGVMVDLGTKARKLPMRRAELVPPEFDYLYPNFKVAHRIVREAVFPPPATPSPTPNP
jgi:hypothetical protein